MGVKTQSHRRSRSVDDRRDPTCLHPVVGGEQALIKAGRSSGFGQIVDKLFLIGNRLADIILSS